MNKIIWSYWSGPLNSYVEKALELLEKVFTRMGYKIFR